MPLANPYCTVEQVQDELRNTEPALIVQIEQAINQASRWIDDYKGRSFYFIDNTVDPLIIDRFDGLIHDNVVRLPILPVIEIVSVTLEDTILVEGTDYVFKGDKLICLTGHWRLPFKTSKFSILGTFGYPQDESSEVPSSLPPYINRAAVMAAAAFSGHNQKEIVGLDGSKTEVTEKSIPKVVFDLLGSRKIIL